MPAPRPHSLSLSLAGLLGLALGVLAPAQGCFLAPSDDVLFACEPEGKSDCPEGYSCEADGCCHKDGSDVEANLGACAVGGAGGPGGDTDTETDTATETETDTDTTEADTETDSETDSETGSDTGTDTTGG